MRMICVEEHLLDPAIDMAARAAVIANAPFLPGWGSRFIDGQTVRDTSRPHVIAAQESTRKAFETGPERLADMDGAGIDMQVLSYGGFPQLLSGQEAIDLCRAANDRLAETALRSHHDRFAGLATLPWQVPDAAARELERCVTKLGLKGALINGRPSETFLDDERYTPILSTFDNFNVPLYVHPGLPIPAVQNSYYGGFEPELTARFSMFAWGWHNEAGIQVIRLLLSGAFDRFPKLRIISGHWGELVPFFLQRLEDAIPQGVSGLSRSITQTYRDHVYVSPSGMLTLPHFQFIHTLMGIDRILYSIDYPYQSLDGARDFLESLPISDGDKEKISCRNAELLFSI
jgi:uncharacterized protein